MHTTKIGIQIGEGSSLYFVSGHINWWDGEPQQATVYYDVSETEQRMIETPTDLLARLGAGAVIHFEPFQPEVFGPLEESERPALLAWMIAHGWPVAP